MKCMKFERIVTSWLGIVGVVASFGIPLPALACTADIHQGDVPGGIPEHPPFANCPSGVACGRCGSCVVGCGFCFADPKGQSCATGADCPSVQLPFSTCFADPAWDPDASASDGSPADNATGITQTDAGNAIIPPSSPASNACSAGTRPGNGATLLGLIGAVGCFALRRRRPSVSTQRERHLALAIALAEADTEID